MSYLEVHCTLAQRDQWWQNITRYRKVNIELMKIQCTANL